MNTHVEAFGLFFREGVPGQDNIYKRTKASICWRFVGSRFKSSFYARYFEKPPPFALLYAASSVLNAFRSHVEIDPT